MLGRCFLGSAPWPDSGWKLMETVTGPMIYSHFYVRVPDGPHMGLRGFRVSFKETNTITG